MTTTQLHDHLARLDHVLCDLPPDVREPIDDLFRSLVADHLTALAMIDQLRRQEEPARAALFRSLYRRSES